MDFGKGFTGMSSYIQKNTQISNRIIVLKRHYKLTIAQLSDRLQLSQESVKALLSHKLVKTISTTQFEEWLSALEPKMVKSWGT